MTPHPHETMDPAALLAWQIDMGADEAIEDSIINRFESSQATQPAATLAQPQVNITAANQPLQQQDSTTQSGPRTVTARPVQSIDGHSAASAQAAAASATSLEELRHVMEEFDGGLLKRSAKNLIFADGINNAPLMVIGDAPSAEDDNVGLPFTGISGQLLDKILSAAGYSRETNTYISNILPWRPLGGRAPDASVIAMCLPFIRRHIELAAPKAILILGAVTAKALLTTDEGITRTRGRWKTIAFGEITIPTIATYHPTYLLQQPHLKGLAWRDMLALSAKLTELEA